MKGIYGCNPSVVDSLAEDDVFISYPIFEKLFKTSAIRGRIAVKKFAEGFCSRRTDFHITIHESIAEKDKVILIWSFRARNIGSVNPDVEPSNKEHSWGGITLFRFNEAGKIIAEIGEESTPGPIERSTSKTN